MARKIVKPYDSWQYSCFEIALRYVDRPGGYTRVIPMGKRTSDTATIAQLEWV